MRSSHQLSWMPKATVVVGVLLFMVGPAGALRPTESDFAESESLASAKADLRNAAMQLDEALKTGNDEEIHKRVKDLSNSLHRRSGHRADTLKDFALQDDALATNIIHKSPPSEAEELESTELQSSVDQVQPDEQSVSSSATNSARGTGEEGEGQQDELTEDDGPQDDLIGDDEHESAAAGSEPARSMSKAGEEGEDQEELDGGQQGELSGEDGSAAASSEPARSMSKAGEEGEDQEELDGGQQDELSGEDGSAAASSEPARSMSNEVDLEEDSEDGEFVPDDDEPALRTTDGSTFVQTEALGEKMKKLVGEFSAELDVTDKGAEAAVGANDHYRTSLKNLNHGLTEFSAGVSAFRAGTAKAHMEKTNAIKTALEKGLETNES